MKFLKLILLFIILNIVYTADPSASTETSASNTDTSASTETSAETSAETSNSTESSGDPVPVVSACPEKQFEKNGECLPCYFYNKACVEKCPDQHRVVNESEKLCEDEKESIWSDTIAIVLISAITILSIIAFTMCFYAKCSKNVIKQEQQLNPNKFQDLQLNSPAMQKQQGLDEIQSSNNNQQYQEQDQEDNDVSLVIDQV